ncbi:uncharacterized protein BKA55DRAFT_523040 [Fusarium redolens]|uniref:Dienelactone hydrolase domain-containing protein n=1 Tax=Fusarium redolens TaxID=48865 RepID=A0A9P9JYT7_FUSRE|nr:uncharacterized protein BKA55DRAFT_523040 [Fusarium redolens]KAH7233804.1 hypothetical protein BKA55DRAFT_523040 [Fusarium redolens]
MASYPPAPCCTVGFKHEGTPQEKDVGIADGEYMAYLATPPPKMAKKSVAVLYLSDIMGIWQDGRLLADQFATNGYLALLVGTFNGTPIPVNKVRKIKMPAWLSGGSTGDNHRNEPAVDPIVKDTIKIMEEEYGGKKLRAVGYCFGAKYLVRHFNAGYIAHPSYVSDDELAALTGPLSIFPAEKRHETEGYPSKG